MTRRCSPDIIEEASPPEAAVATAVTAFPPHQVRGAALNVPTLQVPRGAGLAVQRGFTARKLPLWAAGCSLALPTPRPPARGALNVRESHTRLAYPLASSSLQQAPYTPLRRSALPAPPSGGARTGRERAPPPALPRQTHGRERACAPRNIPGSSARASAGQGAQE